MLRIRPDAVIYRPSVIFGPGDSFFNRFAALARALPVLPLAGADTRFQPVFAADVSEAVARGDRGPRPGRDLRARRPGGEDPSRDRRDGARGDGAPPPRPVAAAAPRAGSRPGAWRLLDLLTLGLLPNELRLTRDQVALLQTDNVVSELARTEGRTLEGIGIAPTALEAIVPSYLVRFRRTGQFDIERAA